MNKNSILHTLSYLIIAIFFFQCGNTQTPQINEIKSDSFPVIINKENCKPYFEFDQVIHYRKEISEHEISILCQNKNRTKDEEDLYFVVSNTNTPKSINDTLFVKNLVRIGYKKKVIENNKLPLLEKIFCERKHKELDAWACIANYRDVLIFKKNNKTIGMAKICFECSQYIIFGTTCNTEEFGQSGDIEKLKSLLDVK